MFRYTVQCCFNDADPSVVERWVHWLLSGHIQDVLDSGASAGELVQIDSDVPKYEVRYSFASRDVFDAYERNHAQRLREEGLELFPLELGLSYSRTTGYALKPNDASKDD